MIFALMLCDLGIGLGITAIVLAATGAGVSIYSGYQAQDAANESAAMQDAASQAAATAQIMAAQAQADQAKDQAELAGLQADIEDKKAGVAQQQAQIEAQRRMVQLNADIGNAYAQWAGNGLLVDGGNDSLGQLLTANTRTAAQDIGIIKSNEENAVWEHSMNKSMALLSQQSYLNQAENYSLVGQSNANATLSSGAAQSYATRQAGLTALYQGWGSGITALAGAAATGSGMAGGFGALSSAKSTASTAGSSIYGVNYSAYDSAAASGLNTSVAGVRNLGSSMFPIYTIP